MTGKLRQCRYKDNIYYFHDFYLKYDVVGDSPMIGGYKAGQLSFHMAVLESQDGKVIHVPSYEIQFITNTTE